MHYCSQVSTALKFIQGFSVVQLLLKFFHSIATKKCFVKIVVPELQSLNFFVIKRVVLLLGHCIVPSVPNSMNHSALQELLLPKRVNFVTKKFQASRCETTLEHSTRFPFK